MKKTELFKINGKPMIVPDAGVLFDYEDLHSSETGRDEGGYMHLFVLREDVGKWSFTYANITEEDRKYLESIFPKGKEFEFTRPDSDDSDVLITSTCYRSKRSMSWYNSKIGLWKNYKFNIIEC